MRMRAATMSQRDCCAQTALLVQRGSSLSCAHSLINSSSRGHSTGSAVLRLRRSRGAVHTKFRPDSNAADAPSAKQTAKPTSSRDEKATYAPGECIEVEESFEADEGAQLSSDYVLDKHIGSGSTADVYKLKPTGKQAQAGSGGASQVLKWSKPLPGARLTFQREWMLGRRLNAAARQDPALEVLLQTGPAVVSYTSAEELVFRGAVLEGLNGESLDKRLEEDPSFCDIDFLLAALQTVLTTLDKAEHLVGFRHGDLRISNIMERILDPSRYEALLQNPETWRNSGYESAASAALDQGILTLKLLDYGHSEIHESASRKVLLAAEQDSSDDQRDMFLSSSSGPSGSSLALQRLPPAKGIVEAVYTFWYKDKSDAWRLLHSLAPRLDGRAWPERKRDRVMAFYELVSELQDVKLEAKFFDDVTLDADGKVRRLSSSEPVFDKDAGEFVKLAELPGQDVTAKPRRWKLLRAVRDVVLRGWSRWFSKRKRISCREVLKKMKKRGLLVLPEGSVCRAQAQ